MSRVEIEFSSKGGSVEQTADRVAARIEMMGKASQSASTMTAKGAALASDSYKGLQRDLNSAKRELDALSVGSDAFNEQAEIVGKLEQNLAGAKSEIRAAVDAGKKFDDVAQATTMAGTSLDTLQTNLRAATNELNKLEPGTREFEQQGKAVQKLAIEVDEAKAAVSQFTSGSSSIKTVGTAAQGAANSVSALRTKLRDAKQALEGLEPGTQEFKEQAAEVKKLTKSLNEAESELKEFTGEARQVRAVTGSIARMEQELSEANNELKQLKVGTAEFRKQKQVVDDLTRSLGRVQRGLVGGSGIAGRVSNAVGQFATSIGGLASLTAGVVATANLVKRELEALKQQRQQSRVTVQTREQSIASLVQNAGGQLTDEIVRIAEGSSLPKGVDVDRVLAVASSVASAGVTDADEIVKIASTALRSQLGDSGRSTALAGAAIDLSNSLEISVKEAFGVLFQTAGAARPEDIAQLGRASVRATSALTQAGVAAERAQELFAASTLLAGDSTGEQGVSIANDLTQAFRKLQQEGIPDTIKVAGEDVAVTLPDDVKSVLDGDGLKNLTLEAALDLTRSSQAFEQVFESALPNSQNRAFTAQIVGGSDVFDQKLAQAADSIDIATAAVRTNQQVEDVESRAGITVIGDVIDSAFKSAQLDRDAAVEALRDQIFNESLAQTNIGFGDSFADFGASLVGGFIDAVDSRQAGVDVTLKSTLDNLLDGRSDEQLTGTERRDADLLRANIITNQLLGDLQARNTSGEIGSTEFNRAIRLIRQNIGNADELANLNFNTGGRVRLPTDPEPRPLNDLQMAVDQFFKTGSNLIGAARRPIQRANGFIEGQPQRSAEPQQQQGVVDQPAEQQPNQQ
ncbi:MAG: hypothetical protein ABJZ55_16050, partial [Fuerstiella sp.]